MEDEDMHHQPERIGLDEMMEEDSLQAPANQLASSAETSDLNSILDRINVRMLLSDDERRRAVAIKAFIEADSTLDSISDMMCAQLALVDGNDLDHAIGRVRHLQHFRQEYKINDTFEHAREISQRFLRDHPGHMLSIAYNASEGNYVVIYDQARLDGKKLHLEKEWQNFLAYGWYLYQAISPDLHAMRQGIITIAECDGLDWNILDMAKMQRVWQELLVAYPVSFREMKLFHTGVCANLTAALLKKVLPERIHGKFNLGCQFQGRLNTFYRIPSGEAADQRLQLELERFLHLRYENERAFQL